MNLGAREGEICLTECHWPARSQWSCLSPRHEGSADAVQIHKQISSAKDGCCSDTSGTVQKKPLPLVTATMASARERTGAVQWAQFERIHQDSSTPSEEPANNSIPMDSVRPRYEPRLPRETDTNTCSFRQSFRSSDHPTPSRKLHRNPHGHSVLPKAPAQFTANSATSAAYDAPCMSRSAQVP